MVKPACFATSGAQPCTCWVSSNELLWKPAVSESQRKTVFEKLPAFFACADWMEASGFELAVGESASERQSLVARGVLKNRETARVFILLGTEWSLGIAAD